MKYSEFYDRNRAFEEFKIFRNKLNSSIVNPRGESFSKLFDNMKKQAVEGDVVAQDVIAYFYRDGAGRYLDEDYMRYMHWEILASANGNKFAIDKMQFFLGYAYDAIVNDEDFPLIKFKSNIDEFNYIYIMGQKICEQLVIDLKLDPQELGNAEDDYRPYMPEYFRDLRKAVDKCLPVVIENMKK